ncbi:TPA: 7-cyano-7-deazaguanine synthase [Bacillus thuringiensis]|nr:7-cyano-7-deazaguanine synthase [Bacillus thuringiensis]
MPRQFLDKAESNVDIVKPNTSGQKSFEILTPFNNKNKSNILNIGNILDVPFEKTWSCIVKKVILIVEHAPLAKLDKRLLKNRV